jgi:hypothetical protein
MNACSSFPCGWNGAWCSSGVCPNRMGTQPPFTLQPAPSPRTLPVNIPFPTMGVTVVTMDKDGNVSIKVDQIPTAVGGARE